MNAEELLVQRFLLKEKECEQLKETNLFLREDNRELEKKYKLVKSLFYVEETSGKCGYQIIANRINGYYGCIIASTYHKNPEDIEPEFMELLDALGLTLPEPTNEDLENDPELVAQALEKAKELQEEQKQGETNDQ